MQGYKLVLKPAFFGLAICVRRIYLWFSCRPHRWKTHFGLAVLSRVATGRPCFDLAVGCNRKGRFSLAEAKVAPGRPEGL